LFAGTEREVCFSVDDGANWQSLRRNMPATSIRDIVLQDDDLVIGTHGRSIWILDGIGPLREVAEALRSPDPYLFSPSLATRVRFNMFLDTPLPPEEPTGQNPPEGVAIDYYLREGAKEVKLEILDPSGKAVRTYTSRDLLERLDSTRIGHPTYWIRKNKGVQILPGHHRFYWDLRHEDPRGADRGFAIAAVLGNTPSGPVGPYVHPGKYTVRLTADDKVQSRSMDVRIDPRVTADEAAIRKQSDLSMQVYDHYNRLQLIREELDVMVNDKAKKWKKGQREALVALRGTGDPDGGDFLYGSITESSLDKETMVGLQHKLLFMLAVLQSADAAPTQAATDGVKKLNQRAVELDAAWKKLIGTK